MTMDEHDDHRRGGFGCFPILLGFFIGVAATLAVLILLGLWADQENSAAVEQPAQPAPAQSRRQAEPTPDIDEASPPPSPLLQPDGAPVGEDAPDMTGPASEPEPEGPVVEPEPTPVRPPRARPAPPPRSAAPASRAPTPSARSRTNPRAVQPRDRIEDDAAASGLTSRSRR